MSQAQLTRLALRALIFSSGAETVTYAATILGYADPKNVELSDGLQLAEVPTLGHEVPDTPTRSTDAPW